MYHVLSLLKVHGPLPNPFAMFDECRKQIGISYSNHLDFSEESESN